VYCDRLAVEDSIGRRITRKERQWAAENNVFGLVTEERRAEYCSDADD